MSIINLEDIKLGEILGRGTFGDVYRATLDNQIVAVKKIHIQGEAQKSVELEVKKVSCVQHPNIIMVLGFASDAESRFIVMEYADGGTLHAFLHGILKPEYSTAQALSWARQCAEGMAYLHNCKPKPLIHRDLKTTNLLLTNERRVLKICDLDTLTEQKRTLTNQIGSAAYMAPEVFSGTTYNEKCDVYSWSIVLWELLARQIPFKDFDKSLTILWSTLQGERPLYIKDWPEPIKELMQVCWEQEPDKRPSMEEIVQTMIKFERDSFQVVGELQPIEPNSTLLKTEEGASENSQMLPSDNGALSQPHLASPVPNINLTEIQFEKQLGRGAYGIVQRWGTFLPSEAAFTLGSNRRGRIS